MESMSNEQRSVPRRQSAEPAMAAFGKCVSMSCIVTDLSPKGARLSFAVPVSLPPRFEIDFSRTGERMEVHLVWQCDRVAGVQFGPTMSERLADLISRLPSPAIAARARMTGLRTWLIGPRL